MAKADEKWDAIGDNPLVVVSKLRGMMTEAKEQWVDDIDQFLEDEDVLSVLNSVARMIAGEIPEPAKIAFVCVRLSAASIKFRTQYSAFMSYKKGTTEANMKKNHYKELYTGLDRLVDSLKWVAK